MSDCSNVEMREALPELMHGRLDAAYAAKVREHVAACAECALELALLAQVRDVYETSSVIDTAAIVRALPSPRARRGTAAMPRARRAYSLGVLRLAAAVVLVLGGVLIMRAVMNSGMSGGTGDSTQIVEQPAGTAQPDVTVLDSVVAPASAAPRVLAMSLGELDDLDADELETLLGALDRIDAAPAAEPDTLIGSVRGVGSD